MTEAWIDMRNKLLELTPIGYTKQELKQGVADSKAWAGLVSTRNSYNSSLTAGNLKTNFTDAQKEMLLAFSLLEKALGG